MHESWILQREIQLQPRLDLRTVDIRKASIMNLWHYLLHGSDDLYLHRSWLESAHLAHAEAYTRRQLDQGAVIKDVAQCRRDAFWKAIAAKPQRIGKVVSIRVGQR